MHSIQSGYRVGTRRWFKHWLNPMTYINTIIWLYQRARYGWAECDVWSLDRYLAEWLPFALMHLKNTTHGFPCLMYTDEQMSNPEGITSTAVDQAKIKWDNILDHMILGFRAYNRLQEGLYEEELGEYILGDNIEGRLQAVNRVALENRDQKLFKDGIALFAEHFGSLWD